MGGARHVHAQRTYNAHTGALAHRRADGGEGGGDKPMLRHGSAIETQFCRLCWRKTEAALAADRPRFYRHLAEVECTQAIRKKAAKRADELTKRYVAIRSGSNGIYGLGSAIGRRVVTKPDGSKTYEPFSLADYFTVMELDGDTSPESFREHAERLERWRIMVEKADAIGATAKPGIDQSVKPSNCYCAEHNPRRSTDARRRYQRDRKFEAQFGEALFALGSEYACQFRRWHLEDNAQIRRMAYDRVHAKPTIDLIRELERQGVTRRADIAQKLGISRQAVYAAINAGASKRKPRRVAGSGMMIPAMEPQP
jgi:hypothetical protein